MELHLTQSSERCSQLGGSIVSATRNHLKVRYSKKQRFLVPTEISMVRSFSSAGVGRSHLIPVCKCWPDKGMLAHLLLNFNISHYRRLQLTTFWALRAFHPSVRGTSSWTTSKSWPIPPISSRCKTSEARSSKGPMLTPTLPTAPTASTVFWMCGSSSCRLSSGGTITGTLMMCSSTQLSSLLAVLILLWCAMTSLKIFLSSWWTNLSCSLTLPPSWWASSKTFLVAWLLWSTSTGT